MLFTWSPQTYVSNILRWNVSDVQFSGFVLGKTCRTHSENRGFHLQDPSNMEQPHPLPISLPFCRFCRFCGLLCCPCSNSQNSPGISRPWFFAKDGMIWDDMGIVQKETPTSFSLKKTGQDHPQLIPNSSNLKKIRPHLGLKHLATLMLQQKSLNICWQPHFARSGPFWCRRTCTVVSWPHRRRLDLCIEGLANVVIPSPFCMNTPNNGP